MFEKTYYLLLLWLLPLLLFLLYHSFKHKRRAAERFLSSAMLQVLAPRLSGRRFLFRSVLLTAAFALLCVAAACPIFGVYYEEVSRKGADVFILLDVSRSMLAEDAAPNRLARAKSDIQDLLGKTVGERVGLIAFAGKPVVKVPLTTDHGFFLNILNSVDTNAAPRGGTAIGDAIRKALAVMPPEQNRDAAIVLITDGEDQESMPLEAAKEAAVRNVKILTVGLGDAIEGARIPVRDEKGNLTYLKHEGQEVWSKVDENTLQEIARLTGGVYIAAKTNTFDLGKIYANSIAPLRGEEFQREQRQKYRLQYQPFLAVAMMVLLLFAFLPEYARLTGLNGG